MALTEMERNVNRLMQTMYGDNGEGLRHKVDKISTKITWIGGVIAGLQIALVLYFYLRNQPLQ